jgi:hypothetical protein
VGASFIYFDRSRSSSSPPARARRGLANQFIISLLFSSSLVVTVFLVFLADSGSLLLRAGGQFAFHRAIGNPRRRRHPFSLSLHLSFQGALTSHPFFLSLVLSIVVFSTG